MSQSATPVYRFAAPAALPLEASFDGGRVTSDGGLAWVHEADTALGVCAAFGALVPEWRRGPVRHTRETLVRQRVFQIACGYADQNDAATLRTDPLLKLVCGRLPETGRDLASQPTFSRLENAVRPRDCYRLARALFEVTSGGVFWMVAVGPARWAIRVFWLWFIALILPAGGPSQAYSIIRKLQQPEFGPRRVRQTHLARRTAR